MQVVLDQHKIVRRAFYSGHFIGNHCHRYMVNNIYIERADKSSGSHCGKKDSRREIGDRS